MNDHCYPRHSPLTPFDDALQFLLHRAQPVTEIEYIPNATALGRIIAANLISPLNVPPVDNSAMDGYAFSSSDLSTDSDTRLPLSLRICAGSAPTPLPPGSAARIFTGAPIPTGADSVIMQEHCSADESSVVIPMDAKAGANVRRTGEDIRSGQEVLTLGSKIRPQEMGLAASVGLEKLPVFRKLRVAILSTGDELATPGTPLSAGQIYNSNHHTLIGLLQGLQCEIIDMGNIADTLSATRKTLAQGASADLIISSGGASVGAEDHIKDALQALGQLELWRVAVKPGKPIVLGRVENTPFIGLPGNPVSLFIMFCLFARPFILRSQGLCQVLPRMLPAVADFEQPRSARQRREFLRAQLHLAEDGAAHITLHSKQGSGVLSALSWADGLAVIPENSTIGRGDTIMFISFSDLLS
ncbi:MAG: molybdopterin molybdotransferase MoeA [Gammaproteobacteria bacterium]|nr:molybdopterin molybdotransferase MoeA [Gammaproteobacteria bacterium]